MPQSRIHRHEICESPHITRTRTQNPIFYPSQHPDSFFQHHSIPYQPARPPLCTLETHHTKPRNLTLSVNQKPHSGQAPHSSTTNHSSAQLFTCRHFNSSNLQISPYIILKTYRIAPCNHKIQYSMARKPLRRLITKPRSSPDSYILRP